MALSKLEIAGATAAFVPIFGSVTGLIQAVIYYRKAKCCQEKIALMQGAAFKIDLQGRQRLHLIEKKTVQYQRLWKAFLLQAIPILNVITAIYSAVVLLTVSKLRGEGQALKNQPPGNNLIITLISLFEKGSSITETVKCAQCNRLVAIGQHRINDLSIPQLISLRAIAESVVTALQNAPQTLGSKKQVTELAAVKTQFENRINLLTARIDGELSSAIKQHKVLDDDFLAKKITDPLIQLEQLERDELEWYQAAIQKLVIPPERTQIPTDADSFIAHFEATTKERLYFMLEHMTEQERSTKHKENKLSILIEIFSALSTTREPLIDKDGVAPIIALLEEQIAMYSGVKQAIADSRVCQRNLFRSKNIGIRQAIPFTYSYENEKKFLQVQNDLEPIFSTPQQMCDFPIKLPQWGSTLTNYSEFIQVREKYMALKQNFTVMQCCLPVDFPIELPNLLGADDAHPIQITDAEQFKRLISTYSEYFTGVDQLLKSWGASIACKARLLHALKVASASSSGL
jgi:hypothetical protein